MKTNRMDEKIEKVGVCKSKNCGYSAIFQRVKIHLSRFYRVYPFLGEDKSMLLDPSQYMDKFKTVEYYG